MSQQDLLLSPSVTTTMLIVVIHYGPSQAFVDAAS